jgi:glycosyltransferase involved in cell wall biosynthesis
MALHITIVPHVPLSLGFGGLEIQQERTITALQDRGLQVSRFDPWARTLQTDILHVFGSSHHQAEIVFRAAARGIPVVITSMFVRTHSARSYAMGKMADQLGLRTLYSVRRKILQTATRIIATSDAERDDLVEVFDVDEGRIDVIGNGVDDQFFTATADAFRDRYQLNDVVLCVASVEPNKNQLTLIDAVERTGLPLVLIGPPKDTVVDDVTAYVDAVRKRVAASQQITWIDNGLDHDDPLLASAFAAARLHVLPSRAEAQGIVNLEAAAAGASLVMSDLDTLRSTFGDDAWYADPASPQQLAEAIKSAWAVPRGERYRHYPDHKPSWLHSWRDVTLLLESTYGRAVRK